jgi:leucyl/phenylalanyl-tRNA--protein transferase
LRQIVVNVIYSSSEMGEKRQRVTIIDPDFLLKAYCSGYFPMADDKTREIGWYSPDPRAVFELSELRVPRSLTLTMKKKPFELLVNKQFEEVMRACAERKETWISEEIIQSYVELHRLGFAHSVECWKDQKLVGGLYGVAIQGAFFGESMFSRMRDASKIALVYLVERLNARGFVLLDTQFVTPHLARFGAREITREEYLRRLRRALKKGCSFFP